MKITNNSSNSFIPLIVVESLWFLSQYAKQHIHTHTHAAKIFAVDSVEALEIIDMMTARELRTWASLFSASYFKWKKRSNGKENAFATDKCRTKWWNKFADIVRWGFVACEVIFKYFSQPVEMFKQFKLAFFIEPNKDSIDFSSWNRLFNKKIWAGTRLKRRNHAHFCELCHTSNNSFRHQSPWSS